MRHGRFCVNLRDWGKSGAVLSSIKVDEARRGLVVAESWCSRSLRPHPTGLRRLQLPHSLTSWEKALTKEDPREPSQGAPQYRSWAERQAEKLALQEAERQALSQRIRASRENGGVDEPERARRRHVANIDAFRAFMLAALEAPSPDGRAPTPPGSISSFKMICALIAQRAAEEPALLEREYRKTLGLHYLMSKSLALWIAIADQLAEHAKAGITREITALGPFAGLRVSTRALLITSGIENVVQLRAAIAAGRVAMNEDITSNGLTRRRWTELRDWLTRQPA